MGIYAENLGADPIDPKAIDTKALGAKTLRLLQGCISHCSDENGWAMLDRVKEQVLRQKTDFDERTFGFTKFSKLLSSVPNRFQLKQIGHIISVMLVTPAAAQASNGV